MTLSEQIVGALKAYPSGLTLQEITALCDLAEGDSSVVGRVIAGLRELNEVRFRCREVWLLGGEPVEHHEPKITLTGTRWVPPFEAPEGGRPLAPRPRKAPRRVNGSPKATVRERVLVALKEHGPMALSGLRMYVDAPNLATFCSLMKRDGQIKKLGGSSKQSVYGLPGQKVTA